MKNILSLFIALNLSALQTFAIVGGVTLTDNKYPWFVMLEGASGNCGGVVIAKNLILSAAHCSSAERVVGGGSDGHIGSQKFLSKIKKVFMHPDFKYEHSSDLVDEGDIALFMTEDNLVFGEHLKALDIKKVELPIQITGTNAIAIGRGVVSRTSNQTLPYAKEVELKLSPCFSDSSFWTGLLGESNALKLGLHKENVFVSFTADEIKGTCRGDSGGPLIINKNGVVELIGISAFILGKCGDISAFTPINLHYDWIKTQVSKLALE